MPGSTSLLAEPLGPSLGIQAQLPILLAEYPFRTQQDIADYLHLLQDLPRYFSDLIALEQENPGRACFRMTLRSMALSASAVLFSPTRIHRESHLLHTVFQNKLQASSLFSEAERNLCLQTHKKNSLPPVFFPPTALFPMRFLHSAAKEHRTPASFPAGRRTFLLCVSSPQPRRC